ncbi:MAG: hypothetical protein AAF645_27875, partial [Myxococcota bacterium]
PPPPLAITFAAVLWGGAAHAQDGDGAYGRWNHGLVISPAFGVALGGDGGQGDVAFDGALRLRFLDAAGPSAGVIAGEGGPLIFTGVELRPFWPALFLLDMSTGRRWIDRTIQSLGVELMAVFAPRAERRGAAFGYAFHIELPLIYGRDGPFDGLRLRAAVRRIVGRDYIEGPSIAHSWAAVLSLTLDLGAQFSQGHREPPRYRPRR